MTLGRSDLDHILRSARGVTGLDRFVLIGSAAILAWRAIVPPGMLMTREADLFAYEADDPDQVADELEGAIGQGSNFDATFGYYCDGVSEQTAVMPTDWAVRSKEYSTENTKGAIAVVPSPNDIALAKLCAWREKDQDWLSIAYGHRIIDPDAMSSLLDRMPERAPSRQELERRVGIVRANPRL
jgi:hypothetical protein